MISLLAHMVRNLPAMQETRIRFLGQKDHLEKRMTTLLTPVFLPREFCGHRSPWGHKESDVAECITLLHFQDIEAIYEPVTR